MLLLLYIIQSPFQKNLKALYQNICGARAITITLEKKITKNEREWKDLTKSMQMPASKIKKVHISVL
jgi:hypothetical protein